MGLFGKSIDEIAKEVQAIKPKGPDYDLFVNELIEEKKKKFPDAFKDIFDATLNEMKEDYKTRTLDMLVDMIIEEAKKMGKEKEIRKIIEKKISVYKYLMYIRPKDWIEFYEIAMAKIEAKL